MTVANKPVTGETAYNPSTHRAGKAGSIRPNLWFCRVLFCCTRTAGLGRGLAFPAPSVPMEGRNTATLGRRGAARRRCRVCSLRNSRSGRLEGRRAHWSRRDAIGCRRSCHTNGVVPAKAETHNHRRSNEARPSRHPRLPRPPVVMDPGSRFACPGRHRSAAVASRADQTSRNRVVWSRCALGLRHGERSEAIQGHACRPGLPRRERASQ